MQPFRMITFSGPDGSFFIDHSLVVKPEEASRVAEFRVGSLTAHTRMGESYDWRPVAEAMKIAHLFRKVES